VDAGRAAGHDQDDPNKNPGAARVWLQPICLARSIRAKNARTLSEKAGRSIEPQGRSVFVVIHAREVVSGINVSRPPEEELLECHERARAQRINDAAESDLYKKPLCPDVSLISQPHLECFSGKNFVKPNAINPFGLRLS
jgi:hypothetical protein